MYSRKENHKNAQHNEINPLTYKSIAIVPNTNPITNLDMHSLLGRINYYICLKRCAYDRLTVSVSGKFLS